MKVAADAKLGNLEFVRAKDLARSADGVVLGMIEVVDIIPIEANLRREELGVERDFFDRGCCRSAR